ncbi:uncharacterized protein MELLADRAFT_106586 [Melampsora larici-populina 98AG31]|uniref:NAD-dependent epimerase/dehydratase domain-containing protein n=1 Tax=Melampsora larici-populina (strain 98AG31 / pathotype 3-4-7) TaxID=747676 RepID=F4RLZ7_MELLP|nr:uncharacterized protein MELLADRAFT_106586 [Melampsora larici-populina 98AG31]EGG06635.1 hypothetical protein MELLADRAFT_106586 [Melampsora larici-populina 98AG31]
MKILITGINGFVGSHIAKGFLDLHHDVVGTVRSADKGNALLEQPAFRDAAQAKSLSYIVVEDLPTYNFSPVLRDVDAIAHTASPCHYEGKSFDEYCTRNLLLAAKESPQVEAVAFTSSIGAIMDSQTPALEQSGKIYTEADWFSVSHEEATSDTRELFWYSASKSLAEEEAWKIQKLRGKQWSLATICPPSIYGPVIHTSNPKDMNMTSRRLYEIFSGQTDEIMKTKFPAFVDVRDVAEAHIQAILQKANDRFIVSAGLYDHQMVADFLHKAFHEESKPVPRGQPGIHVQSDQVYYLDSSHVKATLGLSLRSFEETFRDTFLNCLEIHKLQPHVNPEKV